MTRGKHAKATAVRREADEQEAEIGTYQRRIVELLAEIKRLKTDQATAKANHDVATRKLIAQRDEGISPQLKVLQQEAVTLRDERDTAVSDAKEIRKRWGRIIEKLIAHAKKEHNMTGVESMEWLLTLIDPAKSATIVDGFMKDLVDKWPGDPGEAVRLIQRARGERHT